MAALPIAQHRRKGQLPFRRAGKLGNLQVKAMRLFDCVAIALEPVEPRKVREQQPRIIARARRHLLSVRTDGGDSFHGDESVHDSRMVLSEPG